MMKKVVAEKVVKVVEEVKYVCELSEKDYNLMENELYSTTLINMKICEKNNFGGDVRREQYAKVKFNKSVYLYNMLTGKDFYKSNEEREATLQKK